MHPWLVEVVSAPLPAATGHPRPVLYYKERAPRTGRPQVSHSTPTPRPTQKSQESQSLTSVAVCLTCGMIETLLPAMRELGRIPAEPDHECSFTDLPIEQGMQMAALLSEASAALRLPRCSECGVLYPSIYSFSEGKARCKPCAQSNWKEIWAQSVEVVVEEAADDPIEQILRYGRFGASASTAPKLKPQLQTRGRPRKHICAAGQRCERCGSAPEFIYNWDEAWWCKECIIKFLAESGEPDGWSVYAAGSDPYDAATGYPVRRNRKLLSAWREAEHITVVRVGID